MNNQLREIEKYYSRLDAMLCYLKGQVFGDAVSNTVDVSNNNADRAQDCDKSRKNDRRRKQADGNVS